MQLIPLFSTIIGFKILNNIDNEKIYKYCEEYFKNNKKVRILENHYNVEKSNSNYFLNENDIFVDLKKVINKNIENYFFNELKYSNYKKSLSIEKNWCVKTSKKGLGHFHCHSNALFNFCYYPKGYGHFKCIQTQAFPFGLFDIAKKELNNLNSTEWNIPCQDNLLICFPGNMYHTFSNDKNVNRYSINGKVVINGELNENSDEGNITIQWK